jgi:hypothetical protein
VIAQRSLRHRPIRTIALGCFLLLNLGMAILTSFTGYMGPLHDPLLSEETRTRFFVLHQVVLPAILFGFVVVWWQGLRPVRLRAAADT